MRTIMLNHIDLFIKITRWLGTPKPELQIGIRDDLMSVLYEECKQDSKDSSCNILTY